MEHRTWNIEHGVYFCMCELWVQGVWFSSRFNSCIYTRFAACCKLQVRQVTFDFFNAFVYIFVCIACIAAINFYQAGVSGTPHVLSSRFCSFPFPFPFLSFPFFSFPSFPFISFPFPFPFLFPFPFPFLIFLSFLFLSFLSFYFLSFSFSFSLSISVSFSYFPFLSFLFFLSDSISL